MSRCIVVLGTGRSGTSAVAGVLHHLGCSMGEEFYPSDRTNKHGAFEDVEFMYMDTAYLNGKIDKPEYAEIIARREERHEQIWGVKSPTFARTLRYLLPHLDDVRLVVCRRDPAETVNSYMRAYYSGRIAAEEWYEDTVRALTSRLMEFDGPVLEVQFEELLDDPEAIVSEIMAFAFEGLTMPSNTAYNEAVRHIVRKPKKETKGWGDIAIGVRIAKHPEPLFFNSWTQLLTGGVRKNDKILMPQLYMPAHTAANKLARNFMATDKDSILLIDDDMAFDGNTLHTLRENRDNWEYDIVGPFCTHRRYPPKPIVMKWKGPKGDPMDLEGDSYTLKLGVKRGVVEEVDAIGLAFTLIRREVFEAMLDENYGLDWSFFFKYGPGWESDDIPFCRKARELGFRMAVDTSVAIQHVGPKAYGWDDFDEWRKSLGPFEAAQEALGERTTAGMLDLSSETLKPILKEAVKAGGKIADDANEILQVIREKEHKGDY